MNLTDQLLHHAAVASSKDSRQGAYVLFIEADMNTILRIVLVCFSFDIIDDYLQFIAYIGNKHLQWIYGDEDIRSLTNEELGEIGEMCTLKQNLDLWKEASRKCFQENFVFHFVSKIIPAIIAYWNFTKGGVDSGLSRYLARAHSSPFKVISLESVLWDRLIMTALLSAFSMYKYDTLNKDFLDSRPTFQQLKVKSQEHMNTFLHFISDAIRWARNEAIKRMPEESLRSLGLPQPVELPPAEEPPVYQDIIRLSAFKVRQYYNTPEGQRRRYDKLSVHEKIKFENQRKCVVCRKKLARIACTLCPSVNLCTTLIENHQNHPMFGTDRNVHLYHSCYDVFHTEGYLLALNDEEL